jgi:DNA-binding MarR family transcriptional regulator
MGDMKKPEDDATVYLLFEVWSLMHSVGALLDKALAPSGLNADEFGFFSVLIDNQPVTPKKISELVGMPPTTVSSYLNRLIARGHISKTRNPADGRSFLIELTPEGFKVQYEAWKRFVPAQDAVIDQLQPPTQEVFDALKALFEAVRAATPPD